MMLCDVFFYTFAYKFNDDTFILIKHYTLKMERKWKSERESKQLQNVLIYLFIMMEVYCIHFSLLVLLEFYRSVFVVICFMLFRTCPKITIIFFRFYTFPVYLPIARYAISLKNDQNQHFIHTIYLRKNNLNIDFQQAIFFEWMAYGFYTWTKRYCLLFMCLMDWWWCFGLVFWFCDLAVMCGHSLMKIMAITYIWMY